jgi:3-deoxy-D-manno-octulosonate 8-phosphate phosphatase (KDO 8-P phosphatase)
VDPNLRERFAQIKMVIMDVDGVLTDGAMYYTEQGDELKKFNTRDGVGIRLLHEAAIKTALVTGERTPIIARRAAKLRIDEVHEGVQDKRATVESLLDRHRLTPDEACFIGDDLGDLEALRCVGLAIAVADAMPPVLKAAHYITQRKGGEGAVREVCDLILSAMPAGERS